MQKRSTAAQNQNANPQFWGVRRGNCKIHAGSRFERALKERLAKFGLEVAADKTKTLRFGHNGGEHNGRFDFLGFEFYWEPDRQGQPRVKRRTASKKLQASVQRMTEWIKENRHDKQGKIMRTLRAK